MQGWMIAMGVLIGTGLVADGVLVVKCRKLERRVARIDDTVRFTRMAVRQIERETRGGKK